MKKLILAFMAVVSVASVNAQKNSILLYGDAGVNTEKTDFGGFSTTSTSWNVSPGIGYQFSKCLTVGVQGGYMSTQSSVPSGLPIGPTTLKTMNTEWQAGAFLRSTHVINNMFSFWAQLNAGYIAGDEEVPTVLSGIAGPTIVTTTQTFSGFQATILPAIAINVYKGLALNFNVGGIGFRTTKMDMPGPGTDPTNTSFGVTFGQQMNFGITKNFNCGKKKHGGAEPGMDTRKMKKMEEDEDE